MTRGGDRQVLEVTADDLGAVVMAMDELAPARQGWINLHPDVEADDEPPPGLFGFLGARGPAIPLCTWHAAPSLGIQHGAGPKVVRRLAELGIAVPTGWRVVQDHPRRGLVVLPVADAAHVDVAAWLLAAGAALSQVPVPGRWVAVVHRP